MIKMTFIRIADAGIIPLILAQIVESISVTNALEITYLKDPALTVFSCIAPLAVPIVANIIRFYWGQ